MPLLPRPEPSFDDHLNLALVLGGLLVMLLTLMALRSSAVVTAV
jgi:hypothetical protein